MSSGTASIASLRKSRAKASRSAVAWVDVVEQTRSTFDPSARHIDSMPLAMSTLYACRCPDSPSKSRRTWNPVTRSPLARTAAIAAASPPGSPTRSRAESITWVKPVARIAATLACSVPASVTVSMPKSSRFMRSPLPGRSSLRPQVTDDELEGDPAEVHLGERAFFARLHRAVIDEHNAALLERLRRREHIGGAESDAHHALLPDDVLRAGRRLDELQVELAALTLQERF